MSDASKVPKRNNWQFGDYVKPCDEYDISALRDYYIGYMFNRTLMMFKWNNLPDKMTSFDMEKFTQLKGCTFFIHSKKDEDRYYILDGSKYDNITWNYEPSKAIIVNPALDGLKQHYEMGDDVIMVRNDYLCMGLYPIFEKNALELANTDLSIRYANFNTRFKTLFTANDDNTKDSINLLIDGIWAGTKPTAIVTDDLYKNSIEGIAYNSSGQSNDIKSLIELKQYQLAQWYIELGINANYNMKREAVSSNEFKMNDDALIPLIDQMLECRQEACKQINELFGLDISVELRSSWKKVFEEVKNEVDKEEAEVDKIEADAEKAAAEADATVEAAEEVIEEQASETSTEEKRG